MICVLFDFDRFDLKGLVELLSRVSGVEVSDFDFDTALSLFKELEKRYDLFVLPLPVPTDKSLLKIFKNSRLKLDPNRVGDVSEDALKLVVDFCACADFPFRVLDVIDLGFSRAVIVERDVNCDLKIERIYVLETNVDDTSGEIVANALDKVMEKALDVFLAQGIGKKGRPALKITVLVDEKNLCDVAKTLINELPTLGVRFNSVKRFVVNRSVECVNLKLFGKTFKVRVKRSDVSVKPEFEDLKTISRVLGLPLPQVYREVLRVLNHEDSDG